MKKTNKTIKILCAMSGGVDSSVAATILKQNNYDVIGVFLKFWAPKESSGCYLGNTCCNDEALRSARAVCDKLKIPFYVFDVSQEFKKAVVDYYIAEYDSGRTPNPCVVCNKKIKFGWLIKKAKELGCEFVATGHYARLAYPLAKPQKDVHSIEASSRNLDFQWRLRPTFYDSARGSKSIKLYKAKDKKKDQSYFLWQLSQEELKHVILPIGDFTKAEVRSMARKWRLPTAEKQESQDICFIGNTNNADFLANYANKLIRPGNIVDRSGNILAVHQGLIKYTIGQRHGLPQLSAIGFQLSANKNRPKPFYVLKLNVEKNELVLGEEKELYSKKLTAKNINWLMGSQPKFNLIYQAKIRYGGKLSDCYISTIKQFNHLTISVLFDEPQRAITPGQSVVIYSNQELLGGGIIL